MTLLHILGRVRYATWKSLRFVMGVVESAEGCVMD